MSEAITNKEPCDSTAKKECQGCGDCGHSGNGQSLAPEHEEGHIDRAQFLKTAFGGLAILWGGATLYPIYSYLTNPKGDEDAPQVTSVEVCKLADLPPGTGKNFRFGSTPALVIHTEDGAVHAFKAICTHLGCTVQFRDENQSIYCACHGGVYDASTGKNVAGPPPRPLAPLKAEVVNGKIVVSRA